MIVSFRDYTNSIDGCYRIINAAELIIRDITYTVKQIIVVSVTGKEYVLGSIKRRGIDYPDYSTFINRDIEDGRIVYFSPEMFIPGSGCGCKHRRSKED